MLNALATILVINFALVLSMPGLSTYQQFWNNTYYSIDRTAPDSMFLFDRFFYFLCFSFLMFDLLTLYLLASANFITRALGNVVRLLPPLRIGSRYNQGCVGGTRCQFFAACWVGGGSLGSSCGPLYTCCITPSSQDIQPAFFGPVVNDPC